MVALARGEALQFAVKRNGQTVGAISATVDRDRMIETVLSLGRRERGEIPFVLDAGGVVHTVDPDAAKTVSALGLDETARTALDSSSTQLAGDWVVVTRRDPSGIVFGLARPIRDSLREMRRASLRNLAVGLLLDRRRLRHHPAAGFAADAPPERAQCGRPAARGGRPHRAGERWTRETRSASSRGRSIAWRPSSKPTTSCS